MVTRMVKTKSCRSPASLESAHIITLAGVPCLPSPFAGLFAVVFATGDAMAALLEEALPTPFPWPTPMTTSPGANDNVALSKTAMFSTSLHCTAISWESCERERRSKGVLRKHVKKHPIN